MIKVRVALKQTAQGSEELVPPPEGSQFELDLQTVPRVGDILHIHTSFLPQYFTSGRTEPGDIKINRDEGAGEFKDTVQFYITTKYNEPNDSVVHIVTQTKQVAIVLCTVDRYRKFTWRDTKK